METLRYYPDYCQSYIKRHPRGVAYAKRLLGPLETEEDALRWAEISFYANSYCVIRAFFVYPFGYTLPLKVTLPRLAFLAVLGDHCASASLAEREREERLFFPWITHKDYCIRTGAMQHLACMGTRAAIPYLRAVFESPQVRHDRRQALYSLAHIVSDSEIPDLIREAGEDAWLLININWPGIHRKMGNSP